MSRKYVGNITTHLSLHEVPAAIHYFNCTYVFVRCNNAFTDNWQQKFFKCMGGKTHVICQCNNMPFIPTNTCPEVKRRCIKCCNRRESYVCCGLLCSACLCKKCYNACPINNVSTIVPADHVIDGKDAEDYNGIDDDDNDNGSLALSSVGRSDDENDDDDDDDDDDDNVHRDEVNEQHDTRDDDYGYSDELLDDTHFEPDFLLYNDSDATHDITPDNVVHNQGFFITNGGDSICDVTHHDRMEGIWTCFT